MSFVKTVDSNSWGFQEPTFVQVGGFKDASFIKRAGAHFADQVARMSHHPDEVPVHVIALGATEMWNANRNGDGFKEATCKARHHTFVSNARFYKHHKHHDPKKSYGYIKLSHYNPIMRRIELLAMINGSKSAADRNGGLVDHALLQKLASGEDIPTSMSCTIPYDVCDICGNEAKTRREYCTEDTCPGGGCRNNLGRMTKDGSGRIQAVDNIRPTFFDMSEVGLNADRISYGSHVKAAVARMKAGEPIGGAMLAEVLGIDYPTHKMAQADPWLSGDLRQAISNFEKVARWDREFRSKEASASPMRATLSFPMPKEAWMRRKLARQLAENRIVLPIFSYLEGLHGTTKAANLLESVYDRMPGVYGRLLNSGDLIDTMVREPYRLLDPAASAMGQTFKLAHTDLEELSLDGRYYRQRAAMTTILGGEIVKTATFRPETAEETNPSESEKLARSYAAFRVLAAQVTADKPGFDTYLRNIVSED